MAEFTIHHTHQAEECDRMFQEIKSAAGSLTENTFFCTCPSGVHGGFFHVKANSAEDALALFPASVRATAQVFPGETMNLS